MQSQFYNHELLLYFQYYSPAALCTMKSVYSVHAVLFLCKIIIVIIIILTTSLFDINHITSCTLQVEIEISKYVGTFCSWYFLTNKTVIHNYVICRKTYQHLTLSDSVLAYHLASNSI